ncbi:MAG: DUF4349 domain-containing protein [Gaiellaceae bacterium MAG52_C11]|nr:DUF4349 domain-containing protein [Candidatus Gaiellasilicea maunaloa]
MSEQLLNEIREAKPVASPELRERVALIAVEAPAREPLLARFQPRRLLLVAPVAVVLVLLAAGAIANLPRGGTGDEEQAAVTAESSADQSVRSAPGSTTVPSESSTRESLSPAPILGAPSGAIAPSPGRLQRFQAEMRLRVADVEELSAATKSAMRIAQSLRGYVVSVQYDAPAEGVGGAQIVLRVPTARVQTALTQLSALGTILGQRIGIEDLQQPADDLTAQIETTQREIARLRARLESTTLADEERAVLQARLADARRQLTDLRTALSGTRAEARHATIQVGLTTERIEPAPVQDGRLDGLKEILAWEGTALLYVLVIAGPFVLLGVLIWLGLRFRRRQAETRLLEQN